MRKRNIKLLAGLFFSLLVTAVACAPSGVDPSSEVDSGKAPETVSFNWDIANSPLNNQPLLEDRRVYLEDVDGEVVSVYVTVMATEDKNTGRVYTMGDLNGVDSLEENPEVEIFLQEGNKNGPVGGLLGLGEGEPNGKMKVRGHSTRSAKQKSFKIILYDSAGLWRGQKVLNLNKHPFDSVRVRNKLAFDYFETIPNMTSMRTQFVHLFVKDLSQKTPDKGFVDYGLFTHVEEPNKGFLRSHGLDPDGNLYKVEFFEFYRYPDQLRTENDPQFNRESFEEVLEIKAGKDHSKLLQMLDDVNNNNLDINQVFARHFNRENYLTWLATNILFGNLDTRNQNYFLYSPRNALTWYFIPWDYDGSMRLEKNIRNSATHFGIANYWGIVLHRRFFKDPANVQALNDKIEELGAYINQEKTEELLKKYRPVVQRYLFNLPDLRYLRIEAGSMEPEVNSLKLVIEENSKKYYQAQQSPMPIFLGDVLQEGKELTFTWDRSYDLQGDIFSYELQVSTSPGFSSLTFSKPGLQSTRWTVPGIKSGIYYWRIVIRDDHGHSQIPFNTFTSNSGDIYYGVKEFIVK